MCCTVLKPIWVLTLIFNKQTLTFGYLWTFELLVYTIGRHTGLYTSLPKFYENIKKLLKCFEEVRY